jgi:MFS transporter, SP family, general alpha glucoside:H+ symporter
MYYFLNFINVIAAPCMLNPAKGHLKGKAAFPVAVSTVCLLISAYFKLPEMKGLTLEELNLLFGHRESAREFKHKDEELARELEFGN